MEDRRRASDEHIAQISEKLTRVTTMLEINFDPETGHFTRDFKDLKATVKRHDDFVKQAKGAGVLLGMIGLGTIKGWLKQMGWLH